jgi:hypothetical protein
MVALTDLIYIPQPKSPPKKQSNADVPKKRKKGHGKAGPSRKVETPLLTDGHLFGVLKAGRKPAHGYFNVGGTPVAPAWKTSDSSVLRITTDRGTGNVSFDIFGAGTVTVTVSVDAWSEHRELAIVQVPLRLETPPHDILKKYGYPAIKEGGWRNDDPSTYLKGSGYAAEMAAEKKARRIAAADSARLGKLLNGCLCVGLYGPGQASGVWAYTKKADLEWSPPGLEFWEYPAQWPRCVLVMTGLGKHNESEGELTVIMTQPKEGKSQVAGPGDVRNRHPHTTSEEIKEQKTYTVTYMGGNPRRLHTETISASSEDEAKQRVRSRFPRATFKEIKIKEE